MHAILLFYCFGNLTRDLWCVFSNFIIMLLYYRIQDDLIHVKYDKIACVKASPQIRSVVSITYVSPDGRMMCCCFKLTSLERKQRSFRQKCKITVRIRRGHNINTTYTLCVHAHTAEV